MELYLRNRAARGCLNEAEKAVKVAMLGLWEAQAKLDATKPEMTAGERERAEKRIFNQLYYARRRSKDAMTKRVNG